MELDNESLSEVVRKVGGRKKSKLLTAKNAQNGQS